MLSNILWFSLNKIEAQGKKAMVIEAKLLVIPGGGDIATARDGKGFWGVDTALFHDACAAHLCDWWTIKLNVCLSTCTHA